MPGSQCGDERLPHGLESCPYGLQLMEARRVRWGLVAAAVDERFPHLSWQHWAQLHWHFVKRQHLGGRAFGGQL